MIEHLSGSPHSRPHEWRSQTDQKRNKKNLNKIEVLQWSGCNLWQDCYDLDHSRQQHSVWKSQKIIGSERRFGFQASVASKLQLPPDHSGIVDHNSVFIRVPEFLQDGHRLKVTMASKPTWPQSKEFPRPKKDAETLSVKYTPNNWINAMATLSQSMLPSPMIWTRRRDTSYIPSPRRRLDQFWGRFAVQKFSANIPAF